MATDPTDAPEIPEARPAPTTRLDPPAATVRLDEVATHTAARSIIQNAVEIVVPIAAFLAVFILTVPIWEAMKGEIPGAIPATAAMLARVWLSYKAARGAARWVSR